jgi:hypothetical protein
LRDVMGTLRDHRSCVSRHRPLTESRPGSKDL